MYHPIVMGKSPEYVVPIFKSDVDSDSDSGFPFDDDVTSGDPFGRAGLRSHLDSLAARHPEFAQHLGGVSRPRAPPGSSHAWGSPRKRRGSGSGSLGEEDARSQASGSSGEEPHHHHQFAGRGFPFDDFPNDFRQHIPEDFIDFPAYTTIPRKNRQGPQPPPPAAQPQSPPKKDFCCQTDEELLQQQQQEQQQQQQQQPQPQPPQQQQPPLQQYGLRNTVDLGQRSRLAAEEAARGQRSMSAPPEDHRHQQRADMGQYASRAPAAPAASASAAPPPAQTHKQQPQVRHIPIFVEGRDEPVVNKDPPPPQQQQQPQQQQRQATPEPPVFAKTDKPRAAGVHGPIFKAAQNFAAPPKQPTPPRQATPPPPPPPVVNDPIAKIQNIQKDVLELMSQVEIFVGTRKDKQYVYLDEMLTRNLLKLDDVDTEGKENIRQARKEAIKCIQKCIAVLEAKADSQAGNTEKMDVDRTNSNNSSGEPVPQNGNAQASSTPESNNQNEAASGGDNKDKTDTTGKENETTANDKQSAPEQTMDVESTAKAEAKPSH